MSGDTENSEVNERRVVAVFGMRFEHGVVKKKGVYAPDYNDKEQAFRALDYFFASADLTKVHIVSGGSLGVERFAEQWCKKNEVGYTVVRPEGLGADDPAERLRVFDKRNAAIITQSTEVLILWDGRESFLSDQIATCTMLGRFVSVLPIQTI